MLSCFLDADQDDPAILPYGILPMSVSDWKGLLYHWVNFLQEKAVFSSPFSVLCL